MNNQTVDPPAHTDRARPTAILRSSLCAAHDVQQHPENQVRLTVTERFLDEQGLFDCRPQIGFGEAPLSTVEAVHNAWYVERLDRLSMGGGAWLDADTYIGSNSFEVALTVAGAAVAATEAAIDGVIQTAFVLTRPPGHHATPERGMGFCLLNNVAIAATRALELGMERVAIVDWDVHHGNGTQDVFYGSDKVLFCSMHQSPFYPGTGSNQERGTGAGEGYTINAALRAGQNDDDYLRVFDELFFPALRDFAPELVLISAGYDAHANDPLGGMRMTERGFAELTKRLMGLASNSAGGRIVAVLEGGYDPAALARSVKATLEVLDGQESSAV